MLVRVLILCIVPLASAFHQEVFPDPFRILDNIGSFVRNLPRAANVKKINFNNVPPGTKKIIKDKNGQGVVYRSPSGSSAGFTFTSGNGAGGSAGGFAMGGGFGSGNDREGEWVFSSSSNGRPGKVVFGTGKPFFNRGSFFGKDSFIDNFFKFFRQYSV